MSKKTLLFIILGSLLGLLLVSSIYMNFIATTSKGFTYVMLGQMFIAPVAVLITLFLGSSIFINKKNYELMFIGFLEALFVLGIVILNYVFGYRTSIVYSNYIEYMRYVSMEFNIFIYLLFTIIIGVLTLNLFIFNKFSFSKKEAKEISD